MTDKNGEIYNDSRVLLKTLDANQQAEIATQHTLQRLEDIITETENQSQFVLGIVDRVFSLIEELTGLHERMKTRVDAAEPTMAADLESMSEKLCRLYESNMEFNSSQQIQDRIGQQMLKIIPSIKTFHDQLLKIADKLNLNWDHVEPDGANATKVGYGGTEAQERVEQSDVDDLLSSLGL